MVKSGSVQLKGSALSSDPKVYASLLMRSLANVVDVLAFGHICCY